MKVVACFTCQSKNEQALGSSQNGKPDTQTEVRLVPVYDDNGPNKTWSKWTPSGEIKLTITNKAASDGFEIGENYLVTFEVATPEQVHPNKPA